MHVRSNMKVKQLSTWVFVSGSPSHPTTLSASPTQLLVGQLTRLPFQSGYATVYITYNVSKSLGESLKLQAVVCATRFTIMRSANTTCTRGLTMMFFTT